MKLSLDETVVCGQGCKTHACKAVSLKPPLFSIELTECTLTPLFEPKSKQSCLKSSQDDVPNKDSNFVVRKSVHCEQAPNLFIE